MRKCEIFPFAVRWREFEDIVLSKINQAQKNRYQSHALLHYGNCFHHAWTNLYPDPFLHIFFKQAIAFLFCFVSLITAVVIGVRWHLIA